PERSPRESGRARASQLILSKPDAAEGSHPLRRNHRAFGRLPLHLQSFVFSLCQLHDDKHEIRYNPSMKPLGFSLIALAALVALTALPSAAKTKHELKDAQAKDVGTVS